MVAWEKVCKPLHMGGLGISSLTKLCWALRMRWLWLQKTDSSRPWVDLPIQVSSIARSFSAVLVSEVGNGANTLFWVDKWINGKKVADIAPRLFCTISKRIINKRTVQEPMVNRRWISDIRGALSARALIDFLHLWEALTDSPLHPDIEDRHIFSIAPDGNYSAKTVYDGLFQGSCSFHHHKRIWKSWMSPKCHFFLWLVAHNKCWTVDRLQKRGMNHPVRCPLVIKNLKALITCWFPVCSQECSGTGF